MKRYLKAFVISNLFNVIGTAVFVGFVGIIFLIPHLAEFGRSKDAYYIYIHAHKNIYWSLEGVGMAISIASGYMAAWLARSKFLLMGALSATFCILEGVFSLFTNEISTLAILVIFLNIPLGVLGGYLYLRTRIN